jgi:hypothetical protein
MALNKDKLKARMQANSPKAHTTVPLTDLMAKPVVEPNGRTGERANGIDNLVRPTTPLKGVKKQKRAKDGVKNTSRYSFEITDELKTKLERAVLQHQLDTGKKVSTSAVIRTAIDKYLKTGKL